MAEDRTLSRPTAVSVLLLWAVHTDGRYPPQLVTAFPEGLVDAMHEEYLSQREEAERWYQDCSDDGADYFFTTWQNIERPAAPSREEAEHCV